MKRSVLIACVAGVLSACQSTPRTVDAPAPAMAADFDVLITGGRIVDGSGAGASTVRGVD